MSRYDLDLCRVDLESSWCIKRHVIKVCTKFERNRAITGEIGRIIDNFAIFLHTLCHAVTLTFDLWPFDVELLSHVGCHAFKLCTKFERNRIIYSWVIDDLARFRVQFYGVGHNWLQRFLRGAWTQLHQTWQDIRRSSQNCTSVSESEYLAALSNAGGLKLSDVENVAKFRTFWPPVKIREGGEISLPIVEALPTTEPPKYIWWPSTA